MNITLNQAESEALNALTGLPTEAHMLVMCGDVTASGMELEGSVTAFDELLQDLHDRLAEHRIPTAQRAALASICAKIDPKSASWYRTQATGFTR